MKKFNLTEVEGVDGKRYYYFDLGSEVHYRPTYRVWVHPSLVEKEIKDEKISFYVKLPLKGVDVFPGKHPKTLVIRPGGRNLFYFYCPPGYRGESEFEVVEASPATEVYLFFEYQSERGSLGVGRGALIATESDKVVVEWRRTGRLYGEFGHGLMVLYSDGRENVFNGLSAADFKMIKVLVNQEEIEKGKEA